MTSEASAEAACPVGPQRTAEALVCQGMVGACLAGRRTAVVLGVAGPLGRRGMVGACLVVVLGVAVALGRRGMVGACQAVELRAVVVQHAAEMERAAVYGDSCERSLPEACSVEQTRADSSAHREPVVAAGSSVALALVLHLRTMTARR